MTESAAPVVLAALPYAERQLIVVVDDALVAAEREAQRKAELGDAGENWLRLRKKQPSRSLQDRAGELRASESRRSLDSRGTWSLLRSARRRWQLLALETLVSMY
jgi:hypothetical protein